MSPSVRLKVVGACKPSLTRLTLKGLHSYTQMWDRTDVVEVSQIQKIETEFMQYAEVVVHVGHI